jgi:hypothetical protein
VLGGATPTVSPLLGLVARLATPSAIERVQPEFPRQRTSIAPLSIKNNDFFKPQIPLSQNSGK